MNRTLFIAIFILLQINTIYAQVPDISSFSPTTGPVGSVVSISGSNFDPNPANNIVFFGAAKAKVITASATLLTVNAPIGTTYQPITVTANGLTAYASRAFSITFSSLPFNSNSLKAKVDFVAPNHSLVIKDVDDDGKGDIVSADYNLSVLRNISQPGLANFSPAFLTSNGFFTGLAVDDLNGDGKPDIALANYGGNKMSVFINTTVNNQINFVPAGDYATGVNPYKVAIADFNGDGRPDIVVTNEGFQSKSVSVFYNTTPTGGALSLLPAKDFPTQATPRGVTVADIDMDGKADIIVSCQTGFLSILRNISTINNMDFAGTVNINLPAGSSPEEAVIGYFDADLKPDIAVSNNQSGNLSVLKNNSSVGNISFLPRQDYATGRTDFGICAGDINGDGKPDIAVTSQEDNSVAVLINTSTANIVAFAGKVDFPVGFWPRSSAMADVDGDGKTDMVVGNNSGNTVSILLANSQKTQAVITFPPPVQTDIGPDNILNTGATSNNNETPIVYTSSNPAVAFIRPDGQIEVIAPGTTIITANQPESANYLAAAPVSRSFAIKQYQEIQFPAISPKLICDNDFPANATSSTPQPLFYSSSNPAVATISAAGIIHIVGAGTTTITVTQPGNDLYNTAAPKSQTITVTLPVPPTITITADKSTICAGSSATFTATAINAGANPVYQWLVNGLASGTNSPLFTLNNILATDVIRCDITPGGNCMPSTVSSNTLSVVVQPLLTPTVSIQMSGGPFCVGSPVIFTATAVNAGVDPTYQWRVNNIIVSTSSAATYTSSNFIDGDKVTCVLINNSAQCLTTTTALSNEIIVPVITPTDPHVTIVASGNSIYGGTPITFTASAQTPIAAYQWKVNGVNAGANSASFTTTTLKNGDEVTCMVTTDAVCSTTGTSEAIVIDILQPPDIKIPNAFTPNADGINDVWVIADLAFYPDCIVKIFNRNGALLYTSKGYATAWDGTANGKKLPPGTYYYVIDSQAVVNNRRSGYVSILQ
nr:FG-GAP-like repeat-containing protein [uncultured Mucilaginibacter sp.]